jgi:hypothetical protein
VPHDQFETVFLDLAPDVADMVVAKVAATAEKVTRPKPGRAVDLALTADKDVYRQGDTPVFTIVSSRDCFVTLTNVDDKGEGTALFPNKFQQDNRIKAHAELKFPAADAPFQYRMKDKGFETVIAVCTEHRSNLANSNFTTVHDYTRSVMRSIAVEAKKTAAKPAPAEAAAGDDREISRAAIKIGVK